VLLCQLLHRRHSDCCFGLGLQCILRREFYSQVWRRLETPDLHTHHQYSYSYSHADCYDDHIPAVELGIILPLRC
jgi:hypothetical protein